MADTVGSIKYDATIDTKTFRSDGKAIEKIAQDTGDNVASNANSGFSKLSSHASSAFSGIADGIFKVAKVATAVFGIGGAFSAGVFINQASELQGIRASFESMTGSAEEARKVLQQLNKFSFETAFSTADINNAGRAFLGSGLAVADLGKTLKAVGDVAGATGADLGQLTLPLTQSLARGKLQTQDYYQILNSGAGKLGQALREELAKRGMGDFSKAMEEGKVTSEILFATIQKASEKGGFAFEGAIKQSKTFNGQISNLKENIGNVALNMLGVNKATGDVDPNGVFAKISNAVGWLNKNMPELQKNISTTFSKYLPTLKQWVTNITEVGKKVGDYLIPKFTALYNTFTEKILPVWMRFWKEIIEPMIPVIGTTLVVAIGLCVDALNALFNILTPIYNFMMDNKEAVLVLAGAFGVLLLALKFNDAFNALTIGFNTLRLVTIPSVMASFSTMAALVTSPIVMPAIIVAAAITSINAIKDAWDAVNNAKRAASSAETSNTIVRANLEALARNGTPEQKARAKQQLNAGVGLASGGIVKAQPGGIIANIGEGGKDEAVIPLDRLDQMINTDGRGSTIQINLSGIMARSQADLRAVAKQLVDALDQERRAQGLQPLGGTR